MGSFCQCSFVLKCLEATFSAINIAKTDIMRIALLALPRVQMLDIVGPADVFAEAARQLGQPRAYQVLVIGTETGPIKGTSGLYLALDGTIDTFKGANVSLKRLADQVGYANNDGFRRAFVRRLGISPSDYRKRFP
jgi:transcriptional regulator GlxA family with amidase domain